LPPELADPRTRPARIRAALQELEERKQAAAEAVAQSEAQDAAAGNELMRRIADGEKTGPGPSRRKDEVEVARLRLARAEAAQQAKIDADRARRSAAQARGQAQPIGRPPVPVEHYGPVLRAKEMVRRATQRQQARTAVQEQQSAKPPLRVNVTDPQSRVMPTRKGWLQSYNVQVGVTGDQLIVATRVSQHTNDREEFIPMMAAVQEAAELFQASGRDDAVVGVLLADAGYASDTNLAAPGPDRLVAPADVISIGLRSMSRPRVRRRKGPRHGRQCGTACACPKEPRPISDAALPWNPGLEI
jgi:hypothetical protein